MNKKSELPKQSFHPEAYDYSFEGEEEIPSPQLVFYRDIIEENIRKMIAVAGGPDRLWPHIKTHKSPDVTGLLLKAGITRVKCATIAELEMAAGVGMKQILLAYPLVGPNISRFLRAACAYPKTTVYALGDSADQLALLGKAAAERNRTIPVLLDVDLGQHRTGVPVSRIPDMYASLEKTEGIHVCGLHCYDGHRHESDAKLRESLCLQESQEVEAVKRRLAEAGRDCSVVIFGGTPSFPCHAKNCGEYLSPGTCVIQDAGYAAACPDLPFTPGAAVLTRVISHPEPDTFTLDLGTKAVACDPPIPRAVLPEYPYAETVIQNEEHWVVRIPKEHLSDIPPVGKVLFAVPVHICPTTILYPRVCVVSDGKMTGYWEITARDR